MLVLFQFRSWAAGWHWAKSQPSLRRHYLAYMFLQAYIVADEQALTLKRTYASGFAPVTTRPAFSTSTLPVRTSAVLVLAGYPRCQECRSCGFVALCVALPCSSKNTLLMPSIEMQQRRQSERDEEGSPLLVAGFEQLPYLPVLSLNGLLSLHGHGVRDRSGRYRRPAAPR